MSYKYIADKRKYQAKWLRDWRKKNPKLAKIKDKYKQYRDKHNRAKYSREHYQEIKNSKDYKESRKMIHKRYYQNNPLKTKARSIFAKALLSGNITKIKYCQGCLKEKPLQGHHEDYAKPLEVIWLCKDCHRIIENFNRAKKALDTIITMLKEKR